MIDRNLLGGGEEEGEEAPTGEETLVANCGASNCSSNVGSKCRLDSIMVGPGGTCGRYDGGQGAARLPRAPMVRRPGPPPPMPAPRERGKAPMPRR